MVEFEDMQRLLMSGNGQLPIACYLPFRIDDPEAFRAWLAGLTVHNCIDRPGDIVTNVAFTHAGLCALDAQPAGFSRPFVEGMVTPHRQRMLGDLEGSPHDPTTWRWGGPENETVHGVVLLYGASRELLEASLAQWTVAGWTAVERLWTHPLDDHREHFGFRDGLTNPRFREVAPDHEDTVATGEFVLGYPAEQGEAPVPSVRGDAAWGRNGSYLVFRQIEQDVPGFWKRSAEAAARLPTRGDAVELASKMVGRWPGGAALTSSDDRHAAPPAKDRLRFGATDRQGNRCPLGAHIRRSNPRDVLGDAHDASPTTRRHRLLRRGRPYGSPCLDDTIPPIARTSSPLPIEPTDERGLMFLCLNSRISAQFEFVQQVWLNSPKFNGAVDSIDPIAGQPIRPNEATTFVLPGEPGHCRVADWHPAIRVRGGAYFFLPGLKALRAL